MRYIFMLEITVNHFVHSFDNVPMYHLGVILSQFSFLGTQTTHAGVFNLAHCFMLDGWVEGFCSVPVVVAVIRVPHRIPHHFFTVPSSTDLGDEG